MPPENAHPVIVRSEPPQWLVEKVKELRDGDSQSGTAWSSDFAPADP